jgi:hypothetical protein
MSSLRYSNHKRMQKSGNSTLDPDIAHILMEIADALEYASIDARHRNSHYQHISSVLKIKQLPPATRELLRKAEDRMRQLSTLDDMAIAVRDREIDKSMSKALRLLTGNDRPYLYHGTVFGRLKSIAALGLVPAKKPVWKHSAGISKHCQDSVFFAESWRGAVQWAEWAYLHSRGPRASDGRKRVVIRVPTDDLKIERDKLANAPGCWAVRGIVNVDNADVLTQLIGFPTWCPLASHK